MEFDPSAFGTLVGKALEELEDGTWELGEERYGRFYLRHPDLHGSCLVLSLSKGRVVVGGLAPTAPDAWGVAWPQITVAPQRGPGVLAREIERRLLPRYREVLAEALEVQREYDEYLRITHEQAAELAALLGVTPDEHGIGAPSQPVLIRYQRLPDGDLATLRLRCGRGSHRLELSLPHEQTMAVVELLVGL